MFLAAYDNRVRLQPAADLIARRLCHAKYGAADAFQEIGVLSGFLAAADYRHSFAAIEHSVAGRTIADAASEVFPFSGIKFFSCNSGRNNNSGTIAEIAADGNAEAFADRHDAERSAADHVRTAGQKLGGQDL